MDEGEIEVDSIRAIGLAEITPDLAQRSGFKNVVELLKIARDEDDSEVRGPATQRGEGLRDGCLRCRDQV